MQIQCISCQLVLGETASGPIDMICVYCVEEREYFVAYFGNIIRNNMQSILERFQFDRMGEVSEMRLKISQLYYDAEIEENV